MRASLQPSVLLPLAFLAVLLPVIYAQTDCSLAQRRTAMRDVFRDLKRRIRADRSLAAVFLRAAFHDCITATPDKPDSGCNGSLQFELARSGNNRLQPFLDTLSASRRLVTNGRCVSIADGIQIGVGAALRIVAKVRVKSTDMWDARVPRKDATTADSDGQLPSAAFNYQQVVDFYARKGFSEDDAVISTVGGHAIGGFGGRSFVPETAMMEATGTKRVTITTMYAENLVNRTSRGVGNAPGFSTLPSDSALITDEHGRRVLEQMSGFNDEFQEDGSGPKFDREQGVLLLKRRFTRFLLRMSRLSGETVGDEDLLNEARRG